MNVETVTWLYASLGASLFVLGGVALRSMAVVRARQEAARLRSETDEARGRQQALQRANEEFERAVGDAKRREQEATFALQGREAEWAQRLAAAERVAQEAKEESERLVSEVMAEDNLVRQMEASLEELRAELVSTQSELHQARQAALAAEERARAAGRGAAASARPPEGPRPADGAALTAARAELVELRRSLESLAKERDGWKAKVEALERLVEGVRARSRELASELNRLKGASS
jgi:chromosome segregation ATPase